MARRVAFIALFSALAAHVVCALGVIPAPLAVTDALYAGIELGAVALVAARALAVRRNRSAWWLIAGGLALWLGGDVVLELGHRTVASGFYLGMFALVYLALALLLRDRVRPFPA